MLRTKRAVLALLACIGIVASAAAQQPFSLKQSLEYGFENHPSITVANYDVESAKHRVREGYSGYLPQINGSFSLDNNLKLQTNVIPAGSLGNPDPIQVRFGTNYMGVGTVQWDQVIYNQSMITGFAAYKPSIDLSRMQVSLKKEEIAHSIASAYINVLVVQEQINLLKTNLESYSKIMEVTQLQYDKGVARKTDFDRIRVTVNNLKSQLSLAETNLKVVTNALKVNMGMAPETQIVLTDTVEFKRLTTTANPKAFNITNRLDYRVLKQSVDLQETQLKMHRAQYVPTISAYARYGAQIMDNNFREMWKNWYDFSSIGLKLNVPIFDGLAKDARVKKQKYVWLTEKKNLELYSNQFQLQFENASAQVDRNRVSVTNDNENLLLAKEVFEQTSLQYQSGVATLSDLITAENAYKESQTNYISSLFNLRMSELDLQKANGTILTYLNVQ